MHSYESKQELATKLAELLADLNVMATVTHGFHWNVKGSDFSEYHAFFDAIYEDVDSSIDPTAENILKLGFDTPYLMQDFLSLTSIQVGRVRSTDPQTMLMQLAEINTKVLSCLYSAFQCASDCNSQGVANFLADRIDMHEKWQWQIAASLGVSVNDLENPQPINPEMIPEQDVPIEAPFEEPVMEDEVPVDVEPTPVEENYDDLADFSITEEN